MNKVIRNCLLCIFLFFMIVSVFVFISWLSENHSIQDIVKKEEQYLIKKEDAAYLDMGILKDNPDTVFWIKIEGTSINYPVVQSTDNEYYLNHDFYRNKNSAGWIFLDYQNAFDDKNIVLYGHHRHDGSMFGSIDLLFDKEFYKSHSNEIFLIRENEMLVYHIFSVYKTSSFDFYNSTNFDFFDKKIEKFLKKSEIFFDEKIGESSQILTLSTCHENNKDRLVIHAIKK